MTSSVAPTNRQQLGEEELARLAGGPRRGALNRSWSRLTIVVYPLATIIVALVLLEAWVRLFDVATYIMPAPTSVFAAMVDDWSELLRHTWPTVQAIAWGFLLSVAVGIPLALAIASSRFFEQVFYPILVASQTVPKLAIAPLLVIWFGFGLLPKVLVAFLIAFFPITIDTVVGLRSVPTEMVDLARSMRSSRWTIFWKFRFPYALPNVFGGLKVAITLAVIGAVVGEFVGADQGLGYLLLSASGRLDMALVFAAVFFLVIIGMVAFLSVHVLERVTIPWHTSLRKGGGGAAGH